MRCKRCGKEVDKTFDGFCDKCFDITSRSLIRIVLFDGYWVYVVIIVFVILLLYVMGW